MTTDNTPAENVQTMGVTLLRCPVCESFIGASPSATADWTLTEHVKREHPDVQPAEELLPAIVRGLDFDGMRQAAPVLRDRLTALLRDSARLIREARGTVVAPEDTYDLTRRLTAAGEVMRQWRDAFDAAAREADALIEEEAVTVFGESGGVPNASLFVPDGAGQRIAVRAEWDSAKDAWDLDSLAGWIAETTVADEGRSDRLGNAEGAPVWNNEEAVSLVRDGIDRLLALGRFSPGVKLIEAARLRLAERGRDAEAAVLRQVRTRGARVYKGVTITREDMPKSQR